MMARRVAALAAVAVSVAGCNTSDAPPETQSIHGAQHAFFPDRYEYRVADFVASLPVGYYEYAMNRAEFAPAIIERGSPKPVAQQERYLAMPEDALAPRREFLLLDQRHLLIFSEATGLVRLGSTDTARLEVLERRSDAAWYDVTEKHLPEWARTPEAVEVFPDELEVQVHADGRRTRIKWEAGKFAITRSGG